MAKAGFWLKGARGKLAGSVLQKSATAGTIIRENVTPKNPRSQAQATRRATFAPAAKFYSPLSVVLEQSWEGKSKAESYQAFLKQAIKDCGENGWWVPKGTGFYPMPFQVSNGTLPAVDYIMMEDQGDLALGGTNDDEEFTSLVPETVGDLSKIFIKLGYEEGEQITFIFVLWKDGSGAHPTYCRFILEADSNVPIDWSQYEIFVYKELDDPIKFRAVYGSGQQLIAGAIIASKFENGKWRRSTQRVSVDEGVMAAITSTEAWDDSVASYRDNNDRLVASDVYLNDGVANVSPASANGSAKLVAYNSDGSTTYLWPKSLATWKNQIIENPQQCLVAKGKLGSSLATESTTVWIKIGDQWLLSKTTKGTRPTGVSESVITINGDDAATKTWLLSKGVDASVF